VSGAGTCGWRRLLPVCLTSAGLLLGACAPTGTPSQRAAAWASASGVAALDAQLRADLAAIARGRRLGLLVATRTECDGLATDAADAEGELPAPDAAVTSDLNAAYLGYVRAAQACSQAPSLRSPAFARYDALVRAASAHLEAGERRLADLGVG
jgi:hypothetical protein